MSSRNKEKGGLTWSVGNVTSLTQSDRSFHAVVDKGTLDSLLCGDSATAACAKYCAEIARVLKPGGRFIIVSYGPPEHRLPLLENEEYEWSVTHASVPKPTVDPKTGAVGQDPNQSHYIYVCSKK